MDLRKQFIELGYELARDQDAASDLWSWLPSHKAAESAYGDYASEHMPPLSDVMREAAIFLSHGMLPTDEQARQENEFYGCPGPGADVQEDVSDAQNDPTLEQPNAEMVKKAETMRNHEAFLRWQRNGLRRFAEGYWTRHLQDPESYPIEGAKAPWKQEVDKQISGKN